MTSCAFLCNISNGTYISLALSVPGERPGTISRYACTSLADFNEAISSFLEGHGHPQLMGAAFSTSGWEVDGEVDLVHYGFTLKREGLRRLLNVSRINIVNEFVAKALALPGLGDQDRTKVCGGEAMPEQVMAILGPTIGFGGALLAPDGMGRWTASHCEGGHSDFAAATLAEVEILKCLMLKYGHVSRERVLSIPGLVELWHCLAIMDGEDTVAEISAEEIVALAYADNERAKTAIRIQTEVFAGTASDYALITGARGGVYLSGELLDLLGDLFDHEVFSQRFHDKGRVSSYVRDIPVFKVIAEDTEILGLSTLFE